LMVPLAVVVPHVLRDRQVVCEGQSSSSSFFSAHSTAEKPQQNEQFSSTVLNSPGGAPNAFQARFCADFVQARLLPWLHHGRSGSQCC
jgi:hypothetical protein